MEKKLRELLARLQKIQDDHKGIPMPEAVAKEHDDIVLEAKQIQDDLDRRKAADDLMKRGKMVTTPDVPGDDQPEEAKAAAAALERKTKVAGYVSVGTFVSMQKALAKFIAAGKPNGQFRLASIKGLRERYVALNPDQMTELKAIPTIGADVIEPTRVDAIRVTEHDVLTLRSILNVARTTSDAIKYVRIAGYTRAAAPVETGQQKPQSALELDSRTAPVSTIAVWIPVQNQQLDDMPQLQNIIDTELLYDLAKAEEEQVMYGSGIGEDFLGILNDTGVLPARNVSGDTLIDTVRRAITDVVVAGYTPNGVAVDPMDWEDIVLQKGSDLRYIVQVMVTAEGEKRLWSVPVLETVAMRDPRGVSTPERSILVGDFIRGATLWDRQDANISVGWINDQFTAKQRTILAEERAAFAVRRPLAFRKYLTQVGSDS